MATTGGSNIEITADSRQANRSLGTFFRNLENSGRRVNRVMNNLNPFDRMEREANRLNRSIGRPIANLPSHLQPFREQITEVRTELRDLGRQGGESLDKLARAAVKSSIGAEKLTSVTDSGKKAAKVIQDLTEETRKAQLAVMGLNEDGTIAIDTDESQRRLASFRDGLDDTRRKLETLRDAGDMGSYVSGMRNVELALADVDRAMQAAARGGQGYQRMLREMGIYTSDTANQMAIDMERFRGRFLRNIDIMNSRSTLSKKMMDFLPETSRIQAIDRFFLNVSNRLENVAKKGTAANLAIEILGRDAPMKKIMDLTNMINQGVMGVQQLAITAGVVFGIFTGIMAKAATGPSPSEVAADAGKALAEYQKEVQDRADEIMNTWSAFEDIQLKALSPRPLRKNLREQIDVLKDWEADLNELESRTKNKDLMQYLRGLGPEAAMEIQALNDHTDEGLSEWVALWEEKSKIATRAAMTELEWMKEQTDATIKAMQDSITPLAIAWEDFQQTWAKAMTPFVKTWGIVAAVVVDGATAIGNFINKLNELTPQITAAGGMFLYLFTGLTLILAPLGVGIGLIKGMRANFSALFLMIKPGVVAFFRVAGAATVISGALVALGLVFYNLWTNSERLRDVLTTAFIIIRGEIMGAISQIKPQFSALRDAFNEMVEQFLGKGNSLKDIWRLIGDTVAEIISNIMTKYLPAFKAGLANMVDGAKGIIGSLIAMFGMLHSWWTDNGPTIIAIVTATFSGIKTVLSEVIQFLGKILGQIVGFFKSDGAQILAAVQNIFGFILKVIQFIMPAVLWLVKSVWKNIQGVINGALNVIMGVVKIFSGLFTGDFKKMWEGVKQLFFGAIEFIINFVSLTFYGKILGGVRIFITAFKSGLGAMWEAIKMLFKGGGTVAFSYVKRAWDDMLVATKTIVGNVVTYFKNTWDSIKSISMGLFTAVKTIFTTGWNSVANATSFALFKVGEFIVKAFNAIKTFLGNIVVGYYNLVSKIWNGIWTLTKTVFGGIFRTTKEIFTGIYNFYKSIFTTIFNFLLKIIDRIYITFSAGWRNIKVSTQDNFRAISTFFKDIFGTIRSFIGGAVDGISSRIYGVWSGIKRFTGTAFRDVFTSVKNRFNDIIASAKALPGKIGEGIKSMAGKVKGGITAVINTMSKTLGKGMNGVIKGINWVLNKLGVNIEIAEWDVPQYAQGTGSHPGGPMIVGDGKGTNAGPELIRKRNGDMMLSPDKPTLVNGEKGTQVLSAKKTRQFLESIPAYSKGTDLWNKTKKIGGKVKEGATHAWDKIKDGGKKVIDTAFDVFDYLKNPSKLLDVALETLGIMKPSGADFAANMAKGAWNKVKSGAVSFVKGKLKDYDGGDGSGKGPGFGPAFGNSSGYGWRNHPITGDRRFHAGADYPAPLGTLIKAQAAGRVIKAAYHNLRGNFVQIKSGIMERIYQHNSRNLVGVGDMVRKGQGVGTVGSTGASTGPHLHYEVLKNGKHINPAGYFKGGIVKAKQLAWVAEKGMEAIIPLVTNRAEGLNIWKQVGEYFGFNMDAFMNQGTQEMSFAGGGAAALPDMSSTGQRLGQMFTPSSAQAPTISVVVTPAPVNIDGEHLTDIMFDHVDSKFVGQAEREDYFKGRTK
ncbi:peptidoglycan DD-metalloendopeptidase family protein [Planococcus sp. YIM B11945]|uniref:peptidoglycan DD-metalloendopeptidase family protein n=1 Tax=Planococcus sp. YIM B11945 TaxID=3435410 RepID=UPI003D7EDD3C